RRNLPFPEKRAMHFALRASQRMIAFSVDPSKIKDGDNDVMVKGPEGKRFTVRRADCVVIHGDVKTCGYF
ncbi:MAG TPA: hypothetical protein PKM57_03260, partial [Kiritimatiellia bacterium]|nr:hypothetical protein [Kiritimatiellia bacterium]HPS08701.1 hypothetical protein [Kiritimatiellia bacterium]